MVTEVVFPADKAPLAGVNVTPASVVLADQERRPKKRPVAPTVAVQVQPPWLAGQFWPAVRLSGLTVSTGPAANETPPPINKLAPRTRQQATPASNHLKIRESCNFLGGVHWHITGDGSTSCVCRERVELQDKRSPMIYCSPYSKISNDGITQIDFPCVELYFMSRIANFDGELLCLLSIATAMTDEDIRHCTYILRIAKTHKPNVFEFATSIKLSASYVELLLSNSEQQPCKRYGAKGA